jgi:hypothetical protein
VNYACFNFFEPARFFADVQDSFDAYVLSAQQPNALLPAGLSLRVRALCAGMEFVLAQNFTVRFLHARRHDCRGSPYQWEFIVARFLSLPNLIKK